MSTVTAARVELCQLADIPEGLGRAVRVGGERIAVFRTRAGGVFATAATCPHRHGPLAEGQVVGSSVVCPLHAFKFNAASGECDQPGVCAVRTHPVEVVNGVVVLTLGAE